MTLETPNGEVTTFGNELEIAVQVMSLLSEGYDWVRMLSPDRKWSTQWTVLERNGKGLPVHIASREFDGTTEVITCG